MNGKKLVKNSGGRDVSVEYGGSTYQFLAGSETLVDGDLADVAQYRHANEGVQIVTTKPYEAAYEQEFHCPNDDFVTNDRGVYERHRSAAHSRTATSEESVHPTPATVPAVPVPPVTGRVTKVVPVAAPLIVAAAAQPKRGPDGEKFRCPQGDFYTNNKAEYESHLASAHGLSTQAQKDAEAKALPKGKRTKKAETARRLKGATADEKKAIKAEVKKDDKAHKERAKKARKEKA